MTSALLSPISLGASASAGQAGFVAGHKAAASAISPAAETLNENSRRAFAPGSGGLPVDPQAARRKRGFLLAVLGLHVLFGAGLMVRRTLPVQEKPAPIQVSLITPKHSAPTPLPTPPAPQLPKLAPMPAPVIPPLVTPPITAPAPMAAQVISSEPPAARAPAQAPAAAPNPAPAQAVVTPPAPPAVHQIPPNAVRYLAEPRLNMPLLSRRAGEQGIVHLRILVDAQGRLKEAAVKKSSGFERLDRAALEDIRSARFSPYLLQGQPVEWETTALLSYELER
ncbi:energy transducer TonB [Paucibacter aquatile]|uniref:Energy transducer TonB n=1 Tax=Kinneretia aquatilis TaxID=2070761 RepID=A0A2N8KZ32_9BURK|nr:energy transducer TonB [Paucibacter aquatile]PND38723.1 energy transducer TonB [Paucibacter aquatile]